MLAKILEEIDCRFENLIVADDECRKTALSKHSYEQAKYFQNLIFSTERAKDIVEEIIRKHLSGRGICVLTNDGWIPVEIAPPPIGQRLQATIKHHKWIADYDSDWVPEEEKTVHPEWTEVCEIVSIGAMWFYYCKGTDYEKEIAYIAPLKDLSVPVDEIIAWRTLPESYRPEKGEN